MKKLTAAILCLGLIFSLAGCGAAPAGTDSDAPYAGAPKIVLDGYDYFATDLTILEELPEGYAYAGELTDEEKEYAAIDGSAYYTPEGTEAPEDFYEYQECGTRISDTEVDNARRQWAYVKWSRR